MLSFVFKIRNCNLFLPKFLIALLNFMEKRNIYSLVSLLELLHDENMV